MIFFRFLVIASFFLITFLPASPASALCVKTKTANLRAGPGTKYEKTWEVHKYTPLKKVGKKGKWIKVQDVDGDIHWVFDSLVTSKFKCLTVKRKGGTNVRAGPSTRSELLNDPKKKVPKYASFKYVKRFKGWVQFRDIGGNLFWVTAKNVWVY